MDNNINQFGIEPTSCSCNQCKLMCYVSPCFPTPDDVVNLINAGYDNDLMTTAYVNVETFDIYNVIAPKATSMLYTRPDGITVPLNKCTFLNDDNLCSLHDKGLKPTEGRLAKHGSIEKDSVQLRVDICKTWIDNEQAEKLFKFFE